MGSSTGAPHRTWDSAPKDQPIDFSLRPTTATGGASVGVGTTPVLCVAGVCAYPFLLGDSHLFDECRHRATLTVGPPGSLTDYVVQPALVPQFHSYSYLVLCLRSAVFRFTLRTGSRPTAPPAGHLPHLPAVIVFTCHSKRTFVRCIDLVRFGPLLFDTAALYSARPSGLVTGLAATCLFLPPTLHARFTCSSHRECEPRKAVCREI